MASDPQEGLPMSPPPEPVSKALVEQGLCRYSQAQDVKDETVLDSGRVLNPVTDVLTGEWHVGRGPETQMWGDRAGACSPQKLRGSA